jgi:hypothetical protein
MVQKRNKKINKISEKKSQNEKIDWSKISY